MNEDMSVRYNRDLVTCFNFEMKMAREIRTIIVETVDVISKRRCRKLQYIKEKSFSNLPLLGPVNHC